MMQVSFVDRVISRLVVGRVLVNATASITCFVFFLSSRRRHTRYWRHWSSDVCSSDLFSGIFPNGRIFCRRPEQKILPFGKMPENYIHGVPQFYATAMPTRGSAIPLVAKSNEGDRKSVV